MADELDVKDTTPKESDPEWGTFDPAAMPLGTFAAFPVSDQKEWLPFLKDQDPGEDTLTEEQTNAIDEMVKAVMLCEPTARRLEVQSAWRQELMDRGFHNLRPADNYGWEIAGSDKTSKFGPYGSEVAKGHYVTNVLGAHNDILVSALTRDTPRAKIYPAQPGDDGCITAADAANKYKHFIAHENDFGERAAEVARKFCTDDRAVGWMAPWADAQEWGFEDDTPAVVPETEDAAAETTGMDPEAAGLNPEAAGAAAETPASEGETPEMGVETPLGEGDDEGNAPDSAPNPQRRPRIRSLLKIYGKLSDKCPIMASSQRRMAWRNISDEWDIAITKATFPWIAGQIVSGGAGFSETALDRVARCTINLALQRTTGDSLMRDVTVGFTWMRPEMYMDESCPKHLRPWFWKMFPKGFVAAHAGKQLAFVRNESMDEVLVTMHSRSGEGQNRRSITESFVNPQLRLNNWVDLMDEFFRKTIPRVGLREDVWAVDKMRASSVRVGAYEPFVLPPGEDANQTVVAFPMPTHQPSLPDFVRYFAGELAELLTGAMPALSASSNDDPETFGQSKLQNSNAMGRLGESWKSMCGGFAKITELGIRWAARVQPAKASVDSILPGKGRLSVKIADLQGGDIVAYPEGDTNFPETSAEREARWQEIYQAAGAGNPFAAALMADPRNAAQFKQFVPEGTVIPGADAVEKQQGEFEVLLATGPIDNPQKAILELAISQGQETIRALQMQQAQNPEVPLPELQEHMVMMQQAQQALQALPPLVSSVPVRADGSENDDVEAQVCLGLMNAPEGRRLSVSKKPEDKDAWQNLMLHWQEHTAAAKSQKAKNQPPLVPKVSATVAVDKLAPPAQAQALQEMGLPIQPEDVEQPLEPHEVTRKTTGVTPSGAPTEETISMSGRQL